MVMASYLIVSPTYESSGSQNKLRNDSVALLVKISLFLNSIDVADGGAEHFAKTVSILKQRYHLQSLLVMGCLINWG